MSSTNCKYAGNREEALVAYVYDEIGEAERAAFESHLAACVVCQSEIAGLRSIRTQLAGWAPPHFESAVATWQSAVGSRQSPPGSGESEGDDQATAIDRSRRWWKEMPAWAQVAAALLFLGVSAGIANLDVRYDNGGLRVTTGWSAPSGVLTTAGQVGANAPANGAPVRQVGSSGAPAPWQADLASLEERLRNEMRTAQTAAAAQHSAPSVTEAEMMRQVRTMLDQSERKGERELALRVAEIGRDVQAQRQADLTKIEHNLGMLQNNTGFEVMRQRELLNSLAVRVSQTR